MAAGLNYSCVMGDVKDKGYQSFIGKGKLSETYTVDCKAKFTVLGWREKCYQSGGKLHILTDTEMVFGMKS